MSKQVQGAGPAERRARSAQRWFRGNLHMHSLWSDGFIFPELAAERFKTAGYHFIAFTEHNSFQEGEKWISTDADTFTGKLLEESGFLAAYQARLAEVSGAEACYTFRGDELYVRALVLSSAPRPNPTIPGDVMKAWTQPVVP